jgi:hypothetical protein
MQKANFLGKNVSLLEKLKGHCNVSRQDTEYSKEQHIKPTVCFGGLRIKKSITKYK